MMREMRVIDLVASLLRLCVECGTPLDSLTQEMPKTKVCQLCYRILYFCVRDFPQNELFTSAWVDMFIDHTCRTTSTNDVFAELTLETLLSSNVELLDEVITPETVHRFERLLLTPVRAGLRCAGRCRRRCCCIVVCLRVQGAKDDRKVTLLTTLCRCGGTFRFPGCLDNRSRC